MVPGMIFSANNLTGFAVVLVCCLSLPTFSCCTVLSYAPFFVLYAVFFHDVFQGHQDAGQPLSMTSNEAAGLNLSATDLGSAGGGLYGPLSSALQRPRESGNPLFLSFFTYFFVFCTIRPVFLVE